MGLLVASTLPAHAQELSDAEATPWGLFVLVLAVAGLVLFQKRH